VELLVGDEATAAEAGRRVRAATVRPVLTDLAVAGTAVRGLAPGRPRDVFAGQALVLTVELAPGGGTLQLQGRLAGASEPWTWQITVPAAGAVSDLPASPLPIGALHGREVIADQESALTGAESNEDLDQQIEACGMRHRIASRRTSLVAIAEKPSVDPRQPSRRERLPVELPHGVSAEGTGLLGGGAVIAAMGAPRFLVHHAVERLSSICYSADRLARLVPGAPLIEKVQIAATVIRVDGATLVLEFETPYDGFTLPEGALDIRRGPVTIGVADVIAEESSPRGPHGRGLILRLALRLRHDRPWPAGAVAKVHWEQRRMLDDGSAATAQVTMRLVVPPAASGTKE
jgi:hypothetical protein